MTAKFEFKLEDFWIGIFWRRGELNSHVWVCLIPCFPLHLEWRRERCARELEAALGLGQNAPHAIGQNEDETAFQHRTTIAPDGWQPLPQPIKKKGEKV